MILDIVKLGTPSLREKSVPVEEINEEIKQLAEDMFETMIEANGVGLACPQIGKNIRMFVLIADDDVRRVFINPTIIKTSEETCDYEEKKDYVDKVKSKLFSCSFIKVNE